MCTRKRAEQIYLHKMICIELHCALHWILNCSDFVVLLVHRYLFAVPSFILLLYIPSSLSSSLSYSQRMQRIKNSEANIAIATVCRIRLTLFHYISSLCVYLVWSRRNNNLLKKQIENAPFLPANRHMDVMACLNDSFVVFFSCLCLNATSI